MMHHMNGAECSVVYNDPLGECSVVYTDPEDGINERDKFQVETLNFKNRYCALISSFGFQYLPK